MENSLSKPPFIWFGGKSKIAPKVWELLGNVKNYVEPFGGSLAVLRLRPSWHFDSDMRVETVNDADYFLTNFWRSVQADPESVAKFANNPVIEADLFSRHLWLVNKGREMLEKGLLADPEYYDAKIAGWWVWGLNCWIGKGWCLGNGAWGIDEDGEVAKVGGQGVNRQMPHIGNAGQGVNRQMPQDTSHLSHLSHLTTYFQDYADRLRYVRILNGDWQRLTKAACSSFNDTGIFLDPPYDGYSKNIYTSHEHDISAQVRTWALENGHKYKIVLAGYAEIHDQFMPEDWHRVRWTARIGYQSKNDKRDTETLYASPLCNKPMI